MMNIGKNLGRLLAALALLPVSLPSAAQDAAKPLRGREAPLGSRIRPLAVTPGLYPLDQRYEEMSADERKALKSLWEPMPEADEPPFPREGMEELMLDLHEIGNLRRAQGELTVVAHVDEHGKVTNVDVYATPDEQIAKFAAWRLTQTAFKPALCGGRPCRMQFPLSLRFRR